jgi:hypothetical protein
MMDADECLLRAYEACDDDEIERLLATRGDVPAGSYSPYGVRLPCPAGAYCPVPGLVDPLPCAPGTFSGQVGRDRCTPCAVGDISEHVKPGSWFGSCCYHLLCMSWGWGVLINDCNMVEQRSKLAAMYGINEPPVSCCTMHFCYVCLKAQELQHIRNAYTNGTAK